MDPPTHLPKPRSHHRMSISIGIVLIMIVIMR